MPKYLVVGSLPEYLVVGSVPEYLVVGSVCPNSVVRYSDSYAWPHRRLTASLTTCPATYPTRLASLTQPHLLEAGGSRRAAAAVARSRPGYP